MLLLQTKTPNVYAGVQNITEGSTSDVYSGNGTDLTESDGTCYKFNGFTQYMYKDNKIWAREYFVIFPSLSDFSSGMSLTSGWVSNDYKTEIWKQSKTVQEWLAGATKLNSANFKNAGTGATLYGCYRSSYGAWENVVPGKNPSNVSGSVSYGSNGYEVHVGSTAAGGTQYISRARTGTTSLISSSETAVDGMAVNAVDPIVEYKYIVSTSANIPPNSVVISSGTSVKSDTFNINDKITDKSAQYYVYVLAKSYTGLYSKQPSQIVVPRYTLTVNTGSNINSVSGGGTYNAGKTISISATAKENYKFSYWTGTGVTFARSSAASTTITMPASNVTVTANGTGKTYNLTIDPSGGKMQTTAKRGSSGFTWEGTTTQPISETFTYNGTKYISLIGNEDGYAAYNLRGTPIKTGYTFDGWKITSGGGTINTGNMAGNSVYTFNCSHAGDVTITAQWKANTATIYYHSSDTAAAGSTTTPITYGVTTATKTISELGFSKTGYTFSGWKVYRESDKKYVYYTNSDRTAFGWSAGTSYGYRLYPNGGTVTTTTPNANDKVHFYAQWTANSYTINYNGNGSTGGSTLSSSHTYDEAKNLTANGYTRTGYIFNGWNTKSDGTGTSYSDKQSVKNLTSSNGGTVTLYARWKDNTPPELTTKDSNGNKVSDGLYVNPSSWTNKDVIISASAQDTGSGMSSVKIYNSNNKELADGSSSAAYTQSTEGIIYYYATATDKAGNTATTEKKAAYVDKTPPIITAGTTSTGWTNKEIKLTVTATDTLSGLQKVEICNASGNLLASGKTGASYTVKEETNEEYIIRATDAAGNTAEKKQSIQIDKENSDVIIDSDPDNPGNSVEFKPGASTETHVIGWINKDVPIKVTAFDNMSGIKSIELKDHYGNIIKSSPGELQHTFTNEGVSHYTITVTDNAGNTKTINLTVKIDKTPPVIIGDEEVKDPNYGLIEHQATDSISGIKTFKLYYHDTMQEVTEEDGLEYKSGNIISFKSMNTYNLYWKLKAEDNAGNITEMTVHTPFNFKIKVEADNLRTETENFLRGADAQLKITLWGYVDTVEVKFEKTLEETAEKEEYTLDRLMESGDAFVRVPEKNDYIEYTFRLPEGADPREYRIWVYGYRDGWKRTEYTDINLITYEQLCKEQVHKFKRVIKSSTWHRVDD